MAISDREGQRANYRIFGGLSLHLNYLVASCVVNYDWPFGTFPSGLFGQIWIKGPQEIS